MFDHADALLDVLAHLVATGQVRPGPVHTLGYHTGSSLSVAMAQRQPDRIGQLVLVSIAAYDAATRAQKLDKLKDWPGPKPDGSHMTAMWALVKSLALPAADPDWLHVSVTENLRSGRRAPWGYAAVYGHDLQAALASLGHEVLLLNPEDDLFELTRANRHLLPAARYLELPGFGHGLFDFETATIAAEVRAFLAPLVNQHGPAMLDPGEGQ
jgi:pimeloyl-ACP methyl ester carboxylesterase